MNKIRQDAHLSLLMTIEEDELEYLCGGMYDSAFGTGSD